MRQIDLDQTLQFQRKMYTKLSETLEVTQQIAQALDRQDSVAVEMLFAQRQTPILEMQGIRGQVSLKKVELPKEDLPHFEALLAGAPAQAPEEEELVQQLLVNRRLHKQVVSLDEKISRRLCGEKSFYETVTVE